MAIVPSDEDIKYAKKVQQMGEIMGIKMIDSMIVTSRGHYSLVKHL